MSVAPNAQESTSAVTLPLSAGAADRALPVRRRSAPPGGSEPHEVGSVGALCSH